MKQMSDMSMQSLIWFPFEYAPKKFGGGGGSAFSGELVTLFICFVVYFISVFCHFQGSRKVLVYFEDFSYSG